MSERGPDCWCCGAPARTVTLPKPVYVPWSGYGTLGDAPIGWITTSWEPTCACKPQEYPDG